TANHWPSGETIPFPDGMTAMRPAPKATFVLARNRTPSAAVSTSSFEANAAPLSRDGTRMDNGASCGCATALDPDARRQPCRRATAWPHAAPDVAGHLRTDGRLDGGKREPASRRQKGALVRVRPPVLGVASARKCEDALLGPQVPAEHLVFPPAAHQVTPVGS